MDFSRILYFFNFRLNVILCFYKNQMLALIILVAEHLELIPIIKENPIFLSICFGDLKMNTDLRKATSNTNNTKEHIVATSSLYSALSSLLYCNDIIFICFALDGKRCKATILLSHQLIYLTNLFTLYFQPPIISIREESRLL